MPTLLHSQTPTEYFKELVEKAMARQGFVGSELSSFYLVQLLDGFVHQEQAYARVEVETDRPVAELVCYAMKSEGPRRLRLFRFAGDLALFISGFFSDSIARRRMDLDYYVKMGGYAYGRAARLSPHDTAEVFVELSQKFGRFVDILNDVSEESSISESGGLLRLYERWLQTGSRRSANLLRQEGVLLGPDSRKVH